jgi:hypothetical protein
MGDAAYRRKGLFFLCVLCASVVQMRFLGSFTAKDAEDAKEGKFVNLMRFPKGECTDFLNVFVYLGVLCVLGGSREFSKIILETSLGRARWCVRAEGARSGDAAGSCL